MLEAKFRDDPLLIRRDLGCGCPQSWPISLPFFCQSWDWGIEICFRVPVGDTFSQNKTSR